MLQTPIGRLRVIGLVEGISLLLLMFIAMPLKYLASIPEPVMVVGMVHGVLFMLFVLAAIHVAIVHRFSIFWTVGAFIVSSIPFGTFWLDARLKKHQQQG